LRVQKPWASSWGSDHFYLEKIHYNRSTFQMIFWYSKHQYRRLTYLRRNVLKIKTKLILSFFFKNKRSWNKDGSIITFVTRKNPIFNFLHLLSFHFFKIYSLVSYNSQLVKEHFSQQMLIDEVKCSVYYHFCNLKVSFF